MLAAIIQIGNCPSDPSGCINQPRLSGLVTEKPSGTLSFCIEEKKFRDHCNTS